MSSYSNRSGLVLGFHGCCKSVRDKIINSHNQHLNESTESYDWLGHGIYFWEYNYDRALNWAIERKEKPSKNPAKKIEEPSVIGAIIDLGHCFDLVDSKYLKLLKVGYEALEESVKKQLKNKPLRSGADLVFRDLDCAVIESVHNMNNRAEQKPFDSVRGVFFEGNDLYPNAGFKEKNHIQLCIINKECIKGYFIPRI